MTLPALCHSYVNDCSTVAVSARVRGGGGGGGPATRSRERRRAWPLDNTADTPAVALVGSLLACSHVSEQRHATSAHCTTARTRLTHTRTDALLLLHIVAPRTCYSHKLRMHPRTIIRAPKYSQCCGHFLLKVRHVVCYVYFCHLFCLHLSPCLPHLIYNF